MTYPLGWRSNCQKEFDEGKKVSVLCYAPTGKEGPNKDKWLFRVKLVKKS